MSREEMLRELDSIGDATAGTSDATHALIYRLALIVSMVVTETMP